MKSKWTSRKFILAIVTGLVILANGVLEARGYKGLDLDTIIGIVGVIGVYIFGESWADTQNRR